MMLPPTMYENNAELSGLQFYNNSSMYLGDWRSQMLDKINPRYYNRLDNYNNNISHLRVLSKISYKNDNQQYLVPVATNAIFNSIFNNDSVYFSFALESTKITPFALNQIISNYSGSRFAKSKNQTKLIEQALYTPGYVISKGNTSFGVAAVLVQQRFLDDSFGLVTFASSSSYQLYSDKAFINTNRGTGYQLNFKQRLPAKIDVSFEYRSEVKMNEFDSFGRSYSDPGDFDIPSEYTASLGIPIFNKNKINFSAEKISYSDVVPVVHSGYSQSFLNIFNSVISPEFKLEDLTVYSVSFEQNLNDNFSWNVDVISRQQAPATARVYNRILNNDTASVSYKIGLTHRTVFGNLNLYASFANKPLLIGGTDFGRLSSTSLNSHIEGVASWSYRF
jgi:hypothetical protein